jgi:serine protease Do
MDSSSSSGNIPRTTSWTLRSWTRNLRARLRSGKLSSTFGLLAVLSAGILAGSLLTGKVSARQQEQTVNSSDARPLVIPNPVDLSTAFTHIAKQVEPAVVNIDTETLPKQSSLRQRGAPGGGDQGGQGGGQGGGEDQNNLQNFFNRFFGGNNGGGNPFGGQGGDQGQMPDGGARRALGSGFIVDPRGYIITNDHVVDKADRIYVKLSTDPEDSLDPGRRATVVGFDKDTDIAVIKIDTKVPLPTVQLGNSDGAQVGDWVLAIGEPFGLTHTVSAGIVSAKNRSVPESGGEDGIGVGQFQRFIQTDAAINPGNSGGPLVDMAGKVIGMDTAIYTESAGSEGIGFAMPSNTIASVYNQLIGPDHKVVRGSIGIQFQAAQSSAVGRMYGFANGGVLVSVVTPGGPAAKAGVQAGDVIVSVDGHPVKDGDELVGIISDKHPGSTVRLGIVRSGQQQTIEVGIADRAKLFAAVEGGAESNEPGAQDVGQNKLGITVQPTAPATDTKLGIQGGVTVTSVKPGTFADNIGLSNGVVITAINRKAVNDLSSYRSIVGELKSGDDVVFVIRDPQVQGGGNTYIGGTLP